jgi:hypothetical protein
MYDGRRVRTRSGCRVQQRLDAEELIDGNS